MEKTLKQSKYKTIVKFANGRGISTEKGGVGSLVINVSVNNVNGVQINNVKNKSGLKDFILYLVRFLSKLL